ncbi:ABC-type transport system, substrate-binding protein [Sphingopyxis sp. YR583]|jgi:oligopeptide transport system substrate-binding protein|uniref:ABC transporter substrate-binding protein n=1 Tax=Sphingopyxis sp. YR583 TaxID=1881047 RepID=UPI0008A80E8E|nr:ABC transporter substrate-binding protein [Sphingopyxis sp. YR583]SEH18860.1 ABC-type transport system, substrate-binding protein [Sphingopyxis sp. YR583]
MRFVRPAAALLLVASAPLALTGCGLFGERGPVKVAAIGTLNPSASPLAGELSSANAALLDATSQGLVSYDGEGQIDTGLADRWTVTTDGRSYIFRLREAKWTNGRKVTAEDVAAILRSYLAPASRHVLKNDFPEIETIKAMTDTVIEIRLAVPQPAILELLAQPSMAIVNKGMGWGPMRARRIGRAVLLSPVPDPLAEDPEAAEAAANDPAASIELVGTSPAGALARFKNGYADGVVGGRFSTLPYFAASNIGRSRLIVDPVPGLFGLSFVRAEGFLATDANRDALVRAVRRERLIEAFGLAEWQPQVTLRPSLYTRDGGPAPLMPAWADYDEASRIAQAKRAVDAWRSAGRDIEPLRIAVPDTPGGRILFAYVSADFKAIGVPSLRVPMASTADLRLIDEVAPNDDALWALRRLSCRRDTLCNREAQEVIDQATANIDAGQRRVQVNEAEAVLGRYTPFIPLATPLRWSVASQRLTGFRANGRAQHPLNHLIAIPN